MTDVRPGDALPVSPGTTFARLTTDWGKYVLVIVSDCDNVVSFEERSGSPRVTIREGHTRVDIVHDHNLQYTEMGERWYELAKAWDEERLAAAERRREIQAERERVREIAQVRGTELLMRLLDDEQRAEYAEEKAFTVTGSAGGRYTLHPQYSGGIVEQSGGGGRERSWCAHPEDAMYLPVVDVQIAQMFAIQTDEPGFRSVAVDQGPWY